MPVHPRLGSTTQPDSVETDCSIIFSTEQCTFVLRVFMKKIKAVLFLACECICYPPAPIFHPLRDPQINETPRKKNVHLVIPFMQ